MVDTSVTYPFLFAVISVAAIGLRLPPHSSSLSIAHAVQGALPVLTPGGASNGNPLIASTRLPDHQVASMGQRANVMNERHDR